MNAATIGNSVQEKYNLDQIIDSMTQAFNTDPLFCWVYPQEQQYLEAFPRFVKIISDQAFDLQTAYYTKDFSGAAFWIPPHAELNRDAIGAYMQKTISPQQQVKAFTMFEQINQAHPKAPHWYLALLGVEPTQQGKGYGSALIEPVLQKCDRLNQIAYLETCNPQSASFYEKKGFERLATIQIEDSPIVYPMVRHPQSA